MLNGKKILIENCAGIGDMIMFTPALRRLKELYPKAELTVLTKKLNAQVINELPYIDYVYDVDGRFGDWGTAPKFWGKDYTVLTTWQPQMAWISRVFGIPNRISRYRAKYEGSSLAHKWIKSWVLDKKEFAADIIAEELGKAFDIDLTVSDKQCDVNEPTELTKKKAKDFADKIKSDGWKEFAIIAPYTSRLDKDIPSELLEKTLRYISEKKIACVVVGAIEDKKRTPFVEGVYDMCGKTSLNELTALIDRSKFVVSADSGPAHISCARRKKTVEMFTRVLPEMWAPRNYSVPVTLSLECCPCDNHEGDICPHHDCQKVTPKMMFDAVDFVLQK